MSDTVVTLSGWRDVHEIIVKTKLGRVCSVLIHDNTGGTYDTNVLISDPVGPQPKTWDYLVATATPTSTAKEHFEEALKLVQAYLAHFAPTDAMVGFHNPCNAPFVSEPDQNAVLANLGISKTVTVN
ncbi:hypothetical protein LJR098_000858 [Rhizobium sp. LjRoot98]|uniref:hypothetical protein n=1 Tax=Rhizobium sp. LjRoot98 TaxID=3342345 RepID=UPI003ED02D5D